MGLYEQVQETARALRPCAGEVTPKVGVIPGSGLGAFANGSRTGGPSYETRAKVRKGRAPGADAVGMCTVPEGMSAANPGGRVAGSSCGRQRRWPSGTTR